DEAVGLRVVVRGDEVVPTPGEVLLDVRARCELGSPLEHLGRVPAGAALGGLDAGERRAELQGGTKVEPVERRSKINHVAVGTARPATESLHREAERRRVLTAVDRASDPAVRGRIDAGGAENISDAEALLDGDDVDERATLHARTSTRRAASQLSRSLRRY